MGLIQEGAAAPAASGPLAAAGLVLVACGVALVPLVWLAVRRLFPGRNVVFARWGFSHVAVVLGAALVGGLVLGLAESALAAPPEGGRGLLRGLVSQVWIYVLPVAVIVTVARKQSPDGLRSLGFWPGRTAAAAAVGVVAYFACLPAIVGVGWVWPWVLERLGAGFELQAHLLAFRELEGGALAAGLVLAVVVLPFFEELVFRAFLQPLLVQNFSDRGGVLLTSVLFGYLHGASAFAPVFALSLLLGAVMLRTQRLVAAWAVHGLHNGVVLVLLLSLPEGENLLSGSGLLVPFLP